MDKLLQRVKAILFSPRETWEVIRNEETTYMEIIANYLVYLVGIAAIASFIGQCLIGYNISFVHSRIAFIPGFFAAILFVLLSILILYIASIVISNFAVSYGGVKNNLAAFKVVAYSSTAWFIARILTLVPRLFMLSLLIGLYSMYVLYVGLPILMQCSKEKAMPYTLFACLVVFISFMIVLFFVYTIVGIYMPIF